jgi:hypothetical protein
MSGLGGFVKFCLFYIYTFLCYRYVFMKKKILYLTISVTILLLWESEERDCESSGRCRVQGRGHVKGNCVLACKNVKQFYQISVYDRIPETLRDSAHCLLEVISSTNLSYEPGNLATRSWPTAPRKSKHKICAPFSVICISPTLSMAPYSKENQKHNKKKLNSAIFTPLAVELI